MRKEERREGKEGNNPCEISLIDTDFCVYISPEFIIHPWLFIVSFFLIPCFSLNFQSLFLCCKLLCLHLFVYLPKRNTICYSLPVSLNTVSV